MVTATRWQQEGPRAQATSNGDKAAWLPQLVLSRHQPGTGLGSGSDMSTGALERGIMGSQGGQGLWGSRVSGRHATGCCATARAFNRGKYWVHHGTEVRRISMCAWCALTWLLADGLG